MNAITDRLLLLFFTIGISIHDIPPQALLLPLLLVVSAMCISEYFSKTIVTAALFIAYAAASLFSPCFFLFLPCMCYEVANRKLLYLSPAVFLPLIAHQSLSIQAIVMMVFCVAAAFILRVKANHLESIYQLYINQRDRLTEESFDLEGKLQRIIAEQNAEVQLATVTERNRIAGEIHDNVGHLLSSSILQLGAVLTVTKDEELKETLKTLQSTLNNGMDSIRSSVHDLRDQSVNLYEVLYGLINGFHFCKAILKYEISRPLEAKLKYTLISIVKEGLANVIKHSNATMVTVSLYEHPGLIQLLIADNGSKGVETAPAPHGKRQNHKSIEQDRGMGLENIRQRVLYWKGVMTITNQDGFRLFLSFQLPAIPINE